MSRLWSIGSGHKTTLTTHTFRLRKRCQAVSWGDVSRQRSVVCWWFLGFIVLLLKIYRKLVNTWPQNRRVRFSIKLFHPSRILSCTSAFCFPESRCLVKMLKSDVSTPLIKCSDTSWSYFHWGKSNLDGVSLSTYFLVKLNHYLRNSLNVTKPYLNELFWNH